VAHTESSDRGVVCRLTERYHYRHLLAVTTALIYVTVLLGVSTKATGSGLACNANWPLCDGGILDLFPASVPSFFEWFHRLVAGVTGLFILGSAIAAWRGATARKWVKYAATLGLILLPVQVALGGLTVTDFTAIILALHYWTAMSIFGSLAVATILAWKRYGTPSTVKYALGLAIVLMPVEVALSPQFVTSYTPPIQATHYGVTLLFFGALLTATLVGWGYFGTRVRYALALGLVLIPVQVLFDRFLLTHYSPLMHEAHYAATLLLFATVVASAIWFYRAPVQSTAPA